MIVIPDNECVKIGQTLAQCPVFWREPAGNPSSPEDSASM